MSIDSIAGYAGQMRGVAASSVLTKPVLVDKKDVTVKVGGPSATEPAARASQRQQGFFGLGATDANSGRSAWEPTGNLEILNMQPVFLSVRSAPLDQGPGFIQEFLEDLTSWRQNH